MKSHISYWAALAATLLAAAIAGADEPLRFNRDIRPILSDTCFKCHGPDSAARKADLRLDKRDNAIEHKAIVPDDLAASELIARITSSDPDELMPPPDANLTLTSDQIEKLKTWIAEGAVYQPHWAFVAPEPVAVPDAAPHPVDAFIRARLDSEGLTPAPEADKAALLRRVTLDLTGLPPTLEEMYAFLADDSADAYEAVVDRLLASPAYGERMALEWLDVARYADTFGYQADVACNTWPWRDWVIKSFNENLPYDDFIRDQIAGDLLPNPTQDQILATAFNRLHRQTNEGGSINEEFRQEYIADRVRTFGMAFLSMSFECARCHDHKFDPILQKEYYSLGAFFANIDESGLYSHFTGAVPTPTLFLFKEGQAEQHQSLKEAITSAEAELQKKRETAGARFRAWLEETNQAFDAADPAMRLALDDLTDAGALDAIGGHKTNLNGAPDVPVVVDTERGKAVQFSGDNSIEVTDVGNFHRTDAFTVALWMKAPAFEPRQVVVHFSKAREDAASRGWALELENGKPTVRIAHFWPGNAIEVHAIDALPTDTWSHVAMTYDGSSRAEGVRFYVNGAPVATETVRDNLYKDITYESGDPKALMLGARFRDTGFKDGLMDNVEIYNNALPPLEVAALVEPVDWAAAVKDARHSEEPGSHPLFQWYCARVDAPLAEARVKLADARKAESEFIQAIPELMVMKEMDEPKATYVLARGAYDAPTDRVYPDVPEAILPFGDRPKNRLGLADWLLDKQNPLTARVAVNRFWQMAFGHGLVKTQEDFGSQGALPSHPELLDWLALHFVESGWDVKAFMRLLVTSETYKQDNAVRPDIEAHDPFNVFLARGPETRLSAEEMRDQALATSGLLVPTIGGPSVKPYQPEGLWEDSASSTYTQDHGDALYRRSMYTFWKRTIPPPTMLTFDATSREVCIARRENTQTPLQSLVLLNEIGFVEAARVLAGKILARETGVGERVTEAYRILTGRTADETERAILVDAFNEQREHFAKHPDSAKVYIATGESPVDETLDPIDHAALTSVVQAIMNLEEAQMTS